MLYDYYKTSVCLTVWLRITFFNESWASSYTTTTTTLLLYTIRYYLYYYVMFRIRKNNNYHYNIFIYVSMCFVSIQYNSFNRWVIEWIRRKVGTIIFSRWIRWNSYKVKFDQYVHCCSLTIYHQGPHSPLPLQCITPLICIALITDEMRWTLSIYLL